MYRLTFLPGDQNYVCTNVCFNLLHLCSLSDFALQIQVLLPVPVSVLHPHLSPTKMVGNSRLTLPVIFIRSSCLLICMYGMHRSIPWPCLGLDRMEPNMVIFPPYLFPSGSWYIFMKVLSSKLPTLHSLCTI